MSGGVLVRVVFVQMVFVRGGFCPTPICMDCRPGLGQNLINYNYIYFKFFK